MRKINSKKNYKFIILSLIGLLTISVCGFLLINKQKTSYTTIFPTQPVQIPDDWKTQKESDKVNTFSYNYPPDWMVEKKEQSGHPNYAILYNADKSQCIKFSVGNNGITDTPDTMIKTGWYGWGGANLENSVVEGKDVTINGREGKIDVVDLNGNKFFAAAIDFGPDPRYPTHLRLFAFLTSCSLKEQYIFNAVVDSIKAN